MKRLLKPLRLLVAMAVLLRGLNTVSGAAEPEAREPAVSDEDWAAVEHCLGIIRDCQMPDGMIRMNSAGKLVWTVPYFSNFAAMALTAAQDVRPNPEDMRRVERWLSWYAENQEADGTIFDRKGTVDAYASSGRCDSTDSYAATYLMVVWRYQRATQEKPPPKIVEAARRAFTAIGAVTQPDGLTIAKPDYAIKYLMDNIEVYGGLEEGARLFEAIGDPDEARKARQMAARIAASLAKYWSEQDQCFAFAIDMRGGLAAGLAKPYPHGLAQLFALAHLRPARTGLWPTVRKRFDWAHAGIPVERWLLASSRCATPEEQRDLRQATREAMLRFTKNKVYVGRPSLAILALIDGRARFPDVPCDSGPVRR